MSKLLKRLLDLPGIADLEYKALLKRDFTDFDARQTYPEIDACSLSLFGITADEAEALERPADWDGIDTQPVATQLEAFESSGWDLTDDKRRPLRIFQHFNQQLWLALRGVAGSLPFVPEPDTSEPGWAKSLAAEAARFKRR